MNFLYVTVAQAGGITLRLYLNLHLNLKMSYPELRFWQKSRRMASGIYQLVQTFPEKEKQGLGQQLQETAVQIPTDIAIGVNGKYREFAIRQFQSAKAHLYKLETLLLIAEDLEYIGEEKLDEFLESITACQKMMDAYVQSMKKPRQK